MTAQRFADQLDIHAVVNRADGNAGPIEEYAARETRNAAVDPTAPRIAGA